MIEEMESPDHEREAVESFVRTWSREPEFGIDHAEKVQSEAIFGRPHDVWDVHLRGGERLWVISEPMFAYPQSEIRSLDIALSFHVGLVQRMHYGSGAESAAPAVTDAVTEVDRCQRQLHNALMSAAEISELQAIGVRAREALLSLGDLMQVAFSEGETTPGDEPKRADFAAWTRLIATRALPGKSLARLRTAAINSGLDAWHAANWLTHARNASYVDAMLVVTLVDRALDSHRYVMSRHKLGPDRICEKCGSRKLWSEYRPGESDQTLAVLTCAFCGTEAAPEPFVVPKRREGPLEGDCVPLEDFSATLTPAKLKRELERVAGEAQADEGDVHVSSRGQDSSWGNFFALEVDDGVLVDVRRYMYLQRHGEIPLGAAIARQCEGALCIHPDHNVAEPVDEADDGWRPAVIDAVVFRKKSAYLSLSIPSLGTVYVELTQEVMRGLGLFDPSMWLERHVMIAQGDGMRTVKVLPLADSGDPGTLRPTVVTLFSAPELKSS
jgi:hypothetical protein